MVKKTAVTVQPRMVQRGDLDKIVKDLISSQKSTKKDLETILGSVSDSKIIKYCQRRLVECNDRLKGLEAGFLPLDAGWFPKIPEEGKKTTRSKWVLKGVKESVDTMPVEVKEAFERCKSLGIFDSFGITTYRTGDPTLVGNIKGIHFFIAQWTNFPGGYAIGVISKGG